MGVSVGVGGAHVAVSGLRLAGHADLDAVANLLRLQLGYPLDDVHDEPAHSILGVELLHDRDELLVLLPQLIHHDGEIAGVAMDTVHLEHKDAVPPVHLGHHATVLRTISVPSGIAFVTVCIGYLPSFESAIL